MNTWTMENKIFNDKHESEGDTSVIKNFYQIQFIWRQLGYNSIKPFL